MLGILLMARYTCSFTVAGSLETLQQALVETLEFCNFEIIYDTGDYVMARERPGQVAFARLVTLEALIDKTTATVEGVGVNFVVKNEELPLQVDNHCRQMYDRLMENLVAQENLQLIERVAAV